MRDERRRGGATAGAAGTEGGAIGVEVGVSIAGMDVEAGKIFGTVRDVGSGAAGEESESMEGKSAPGRSGASEGEAEGVR
jgi:hypothetical protein